jgi:hypothetical protein
VIGDEKEGRMGCLLVVIFRVLAAFGYWPRTILSGIGVGAVVGLIIGLIRGSGFPILYGCIYGFVGGLIFEGIVRLIVRIDNKRRAGK